MYSFKHILVFCFIAASVPAHTFSCEEGPNDLPPVPRDPRVEGYSHGTSFGFDHKYRREAYDTDSEVDLSGVQFWDQTTSRIATNVRANFMQVEGLVRPGLTREVLGDLFELTPDQKNAPSDEFKRTVDQKWTDGFSKHFRIYINDKHYNKFKAETQADWEKRKAAGEEMGRSPKDLSDKEWQTLFHSHHVKVYNDLLAGKAFNSTKKHSEEYAKYGQQSWNDWVKKAGAHGVPQNIREDQLGKAGKNSRSIPLTNDIDDIWMHAIGLVETERQLSNRNLGEKPEEGHGSSRGLASAGSRSHNSKISEKDFIIDTEATLSNEFMMQSMVQFFADKDDSFQTYSELRDSWKSKMDDLMNGKGIAFYTTTDNIIEGDKNGDKFRKEFKTQLTLAKTYSEQIKNGAANSAELQLKLDAANKQIEEMREKIKKNLRVELAAHIVDELKVDKARRTGNQMEDLNKEAKTHAEAKVRKLWELGEHERIPKEQKEAFDRHVDNEFHRYKMHNIDVENPMWSADIDGDGKTDIPGLDDDPFRGHKNAYVKYEAHSALTSAQQGYLAKCLSMTWKKSLGFPPADKSFAAYTKFKSKVEASTKTCVDKLFPERAKRLRARADTFAASFYSEFISNQKHALDNAMAFGSSLKRHERGLNYLIQASTAGDPNAPKDNKALLKELSESRHARREEAQYFSQTYGVRPASNDNRGLDFSTFDVANAEKMVNDPRARIFLQRTMGENALPAMQQLMQLKTIQDTANEEGGNLWLGEGSQPQTIGDTVFWLGMKYPNKDYSKVNMNGKLIIKKMPLEEYRQKVCKEGKVAAKRFNDAIRDYQITSATMSGQNLRNFFGIAFGTGTKAIRSTDEAREELYEAIEQMRQFNYEYGIMKKADNQDNSSPLVDALRRSFIQNDEFDPVEIPQAGYDMIRKQIDENAHALKWSALKGMGSVAAEVGLAALTATGVGAPVALGIRGVAYGVKGARGVNLLMKGKTILTTAKGFRNFRHATKAKYADRGFRHASYAAGAKSVVFGMGFGNLINPAQALFSARAKHAHKLDNGEQSNFAHQWHEDFSAGFEGMNSPAGAIQMGLTMPLMASVGEFYKLGGGTPWKMFGRWGGGKSFSQLLASGEKGAKTANMIANTQAAVLTTAAMKPYEIYMVERGVWGLNEQIEDLRKEIQKAGSGAEGDKKRKELQSYIVDLEAEKAELRESEWRDVITYDIIMGGAFVRMPAEFFTDIKIGKRPYMKAVEASIARNAKEVKFGAKTTKTFTMDYFAYKRYQAEVAKLNTLRKPGANIPDYEPIKLKGKDANGHYVFELKDGVKWQSATINGGSMGRTIFPPDWTPDYSQYGVY